MSNGPYPAIGLYWIVNVDPTIGLGISAPLNQLLIRTDAPSLYYKSGTANTAWTVLAGGGGGGGLAVQDEGTPLAGNPQTTMNFVGAGVTATRVGGVAVVAIPGAGVGGATGVFTYQPHGAFTGPDVFSTWAALYARLDAVRTAADVSGRYTIVMDDSASGLGVTIPAGAWDMFGVTWVDVQGFELLNPTIVIMAEGSAVTNLLSIVGLFVQQAAGNTTSNIILMNSQTLDLSGTFIRGKSGNTSHLVEINGASFYMNDESTVANDDGNAPIVITPGNAFLVLGTGALSQFLGGTVVGDATTTLTLNAQTISTVIGWPQIFALGTNTITQEQPYWGGNIGSPNGIVGGPLGGRYVDYATGFEYRNTDGLTTWALVPTAAADPSLVPLINGNGGTASAGTPVYSSSGGHFDFAKADALATSALVIGLAAADILTGASGSIKTSDALTLTTGQWDARTGQVGGLTPGAQYYVDPATAGKLTITPTAIVGQVRAPIGFALSTTIMLIRVSTPSNVVLI